MTKFNICTRCTVEADMIVEAETIEDATAKLSGKELFEEKANAEFGFDEEKLDRLDIEVGSVWAYGDPSPTGNQGVERSWVWNMESIKGSLSESYSRINELIEKLDKYDPDGPIGEKHGYHESALDNVRKAADALDNLNFTEHEGVSAIQKDMRDLLIGHTAESTKGSESSRKDVVEKAKGIVKKNFAAFGY